MDVQQCAGGIYRAKVLKSITEINEAEWNSIVGEDRILCSYGYLRAIEESKINDCDYRYLLVYDGERLIAHTCIYSITFELDTLAKGAIKKLISSIRRVFPRFLKLRFVECGTPVALGNTMSFANDSVKEKALGTIIKGMEDFGKSKNIGLFLLRDFIEGERFFYDSLERYGYVRVTNLPNTVMDCKWSSFDEYLDNLNAHYRNKLKRRIRRACYNGAYIEIMGDFGDIAPDLLKLWRNTYERAKEYKREILTEDFFRRISLYLKGKSRVILLKIEEKIAGFMLVLIDDNTLRSMYVGIDYRHNKECAIYFNCLYTAIKLALDESKRNIDMGITTISPKLELGARIEPLFMYMKHRNFFLNLIVTTIFKITMPKETHKSKNVFKEKTNSR